jgi:O-antigen ligase
VLSAARDANSVHAPNRIASALLIVAIVGAPFPFGSSDPLAIAFWCLLLGIAAICVSPRGLAKGQFLLLAGIGAVVLLYGLVLHEQLSSQPWLAMPHPLWSEASSALGAPIEPSVSIARYQPFFSLGAALAGILALSLGLIVGADRNRARQLLLFFGWSGALYALYGILGDLIDPTMILWRKKETGIVVTGTFINRNTAAAYFGSCAVVWLLLLSERIYRRLPEPPFHWKVFTNRLLSDRSVDSLVALVMFFLCLAAMFMTQSRAGVVVSLAAMVIAVCIFFYRELPSRMSAAIVFAAIAGVALFLLQFLGGSVGRRFDAVGLADGGRLDSYRSTLRMIGEHPWWGTGLGTFVWSFPSYRSSDISIWGVWDIAHSTPLELAADMGIPFSILIGLGWIAILAVLIRGVLARGPSESIVPLSAFSVALIGLMHSMVDFTFQIPGFAIVAFALVGAGLGRSFPSNSKRSAAG